MEDMKGQILLFFKLYEPSVEKLRYVGKICVMGNKKPEDILIELNELAGFSPNEDIELFKEIKFFPEITCIPIDKKSTFHESRLQDGDIICFQRSLQVGDGQQYRYPEIRSFFEDIPNRQVVHFRVKNYDRILPPQLEFDTWFTADEFIQRYEFSLDDDNIQRYEFSLTKFSLELSMLDTYNNVVERVAQI